MKESRRYPGGEWLKDHPRVLEILYDSSKAMLKKLYTAMKRVAPKGTEHFMIWSEEVTKGYAFNCQMCGQCILHSTGMTCPMNCPKNLRNGSCGGVRVNGNCEVIPDMPCVWVQAWERSQQMSSYQDDILHLQPPVDRQLQDTSSWINPLEGTDTQTPPCWVPLSELEVR